MDRLPLVVTSEIKYMQNRSVTIKKGKNFFSILFDNKIDNNVAREYNCMEKVHVYKTIFQSTFKILFSKFTVQNSNESAPNKHPPS